MWQIYSALIVTLMTPNLEEEHMPVVNNWCDLARKFGDVFLNVYTSESVTPYMHVFIYHVEHFLKTVGPIEVWANYDIEGWHRINKSTIKYMTSGFGGSKKKPYGLPTEQLNAAIRLKEQHLNNPTLRRSPATNWTSEHINSNDIIDGNKELMEIIQQVEFERMELEFEELDYYVNINDLISEDNNDVAMDLPGDREIITLLLQMQNLPL